MSFRFYLSTLASIVVGAALCAWYIHTSNSLIIGVASPFLYILLVVIPLLGCITATKWRYESVHLQPVHHEPSREQLLLIAASCGAPMLIMKVGNDLIVNSVPLWGWLAVIFGLAWLLSHLLMFNFDDPRHQ
jgi:hypothetical protein